MLIRHFIPLAVLIVAVVGGLADKLGVPPAPFVVIASVACVMLMLQLEGHKLGNAIGELVRAFKAQRQV